MVTLTRLCRPAGVAHATAHPFAVSTLIAATLLAAISAGPAQAQQTQSLSSGADRAPPPAAVTL
ncbi:MAG: hypothetical protein KI785_10440, partial [Devosiaceae bacterium]|nr:hypothetical protein [Devosiaceae bacterium MH13]